MVVNEICMQLKEIKNTQQNATQKYSKTNALGNESIVKCESVIAKHKSAYTKNAIVHVKMLQRHNHKLYT